MGIINLDDSSGWRQIIENIENFKGGKDCEKIIKKFDELITYGNYAGNSIRRMF